MQAERSKRSLTRGAASPHATRDRQTPVGPGVLYFLFMRAVMIICPFFVNFESSDSHNAAAVPYPLDLQSTATPAATSTVPLNAPARRNARFKLGAHT